MPTNARTTTPSPTRRLRLKSSSTQKQTGSLKMARKGSIKHFQKAKNDKSDEFYTILADIERELSEADAR
jgi:hypothetical protein